MYKLLSREYNKESGITDETWYNEAEGKITMRRLQDVEPVLNLNKEQFNSHSSHTNYSDADGIFQVARIPLILIEQWMMQGFNWFQATDAEKRAKLNDRDNRKLLVRPGRL